MRRRILPGDLAFWVEPDHHVGTFICDPDIVFLVHAHGVRERPGIQAVADLANKFSVFVKFQQLRGGRAVGRTGGVAASENKDVALGVDRHAGHFAEIHSGGQLQRVGRGIERNVRGALGEDDASGANIKSARTSANFFHSETSSILQSWALLDAENMQAGVEPNCCSMICKVANCRRIYRFARRTPMEKHFGEPVPDWAEWRVPPLPGAFSSHGAAFPPLTWWATVSRPSGTFATQLCIPRIVLLSKIPTACCVQLRRGGKRSPPRGKRWERVATASESPGRRRQLISGALL